MLDSFPSHAIAIVGLAGRFPDARGIDDFWRNIRDGVESLVEFSDADLEAAGVPAELRAHANYVRRGTVLADAEDFDAGFFGFAPREAQVIDPQHRIFLECAWEALEHAGYGDTHGVHRAIGVYAGAGMNTYLLSQVLRDPALMAAVGGYQVMLGNDKDFLCTRVSYKLDLRGPSMTVQTACSTSLVAVEVACRALQRGECDMALAGGVSVGFPQRGGYLFQEGMILSPDGHCRPFDAEARGTRPGAGAGIVVLKRLSDALADNDTIHAVIRGAAINNDGAGKAGYTAPSIEGQLEAIVTAQMLAGVEPRSIGYVEAHGTGTPLGDPIEIAALTQAFRAGTADTGFCRLGSLKANIGHLDTAAGVAGLIKAVLVLEHGTIPPLVNFRKANPQLGLDAGPFVASAEAHPWPAGPTPRRAAVSSFGIGGTNAHVILEQAPAAAPGPSPEEQLLVLSAKSATALERATENLAAHLDAHPGLPLADAAWTLQGGRAAFAHRRALVARDATQAVALLRQPQRSPVMSGTHEGAARPVAFLFTGQGSQHPGMGAALYAAQPVYAEVIDRCAELLRPHLGLDLRTVMLRDDAGASIHETRLTQPALFCTELALAALWRQRGIEPAAMLGHSIGEYVAAHLAGVMSLEDALSLVATRGRLMQAMPAGTMAAVHLAAGELAALLVPGVEIAAINAPSLCTVSGPVDAVADMLARLQERGVDARALHTSHAFHSAMMDAALGPFAAAFDGIALSPPSIPYVSNLTGTWITPEQATSSAYYARQLRNAVRFADGVRTLDADPSLYLLEVGPGQSLATLARLSLGQAGARRVGASMPRPNDTRSEAQALLEATGAMWLAGVDIAWSGLHSGTKPRRVPLPTYPFERKRYGAEPAAAKPATSTAQPGSQIATASTRAVDDWFWEPSWHRSTALAELVPSNGQGVERWLVMHNGDAAAETLVESLELQGIEVVSALPGRKFARTAPGRYTIDPDSRSDHEALLAAAGEAGQALDCIAHLWNVSAPRTDDIESALASARSSAFYGLVHLAQSLAPLGRTSPVPVLVVSSDRELVLGNEALRPERSLLLGPAYLMPLDVPSLRCRAIDLAGTEWTASAAGRLATSLRAEAQAMDSEDAVAYRGGYRWTPALRPRQLKLRDEALPLRESGTYMVTGGTGGIGLTIADDLARACRARLVLVSRSVFPPRHEWDALLACDATPISLQARLRGVRQLEQAGAEVLLCAADVSDEAQMTAVVHAAQTRFGAIHGVVHAAGLLGTGSMLDKTTAGIESVLRPKIEGTLVLDRVLAGARLDFFAMCSSISTSFGSAGMADYSAANAFQDAFAKSGRARSTRRAIAIGWDSWREVGFAAAQGGDNEGHAALRFAIRPQEGAQAWRRILATGLAHVYVTRQVMPDMLRDVETLKTWLRASEAGAGAGDASASDGKPGHDSRKSGVTALAGALRPEDVEARIAAIWVELLGIEAVGLDDDFFMLGGHSLLATRVIARIDDQFGARLSLRDLFEGPSVRQVAEKVKSRVQGSATPEPSMRDEDREEIEF